MNKLKPLLSKFRILFFSIPQLFKKYYTWFLGAIFLLIIILWAGIFYKYAYLVTTTVSEVSLKEIKIPEELLNNVLKEIEKREELFNSPPKMIYPDLFK